MEDKEKIEELYERIWQLENRNSDAIEYMENYIKVEEYNYPVKCEFKEVIKILKGENNENKN